MSSKEFTCFGEALSQISGLTVRREKALAYSSEETLIESLSLLDLEVASQRPSDLDLVREFSLVSAKELTAGNPGR